MREAAEWAYDKAVKQAQQKFAKLQAAAGGGLKADRKDLDDRIAQAQGDLAQRRYLRC